MLGRILASHRQRVRIVGIAGAATFATLLSADLTFPGDKHASCDSIQSRISQRITNNKSFNLKEIQPQKFQIEEKTNTRFPAMLQIKNDHIVQLGIVSVRCMMGLCNLNIARAYSYAIYLSPYAIISCEDAESISDVYKVLLKTDYSNVSEPSKPQYDYQPMLLRIVLARDADGGHLAKGFDRTILWRVRKAQQGNRQGEGKTNLKELTALFRHQKHWPKGTVIDFARDESGFLTVFIDSQQVLHLKSPMLSWAVFDAYIGTSGHLSHDAKDDLVRQIQEFVADITG